ncbi:putative T7SS-secreted protein [Streptomyces hydrogenans]
MVDWKGWGDQLVDGVDRTLDKGGELLGEGVDYVTDKTGQALDKVGAHDWADAVEDWGDETASALGAQVGEQQLGQTEEADELIHGKPSEIAATVKNLRDFQKAFDLVGGGMRKLDPAQWKGEAADVFRAKFQTLPTDWLHAADAMENAAEALETYARVVTGAQSKAREAIALHKEGDHDSRKAVDSYNQKVDAYNAAREGDSPLPRPEPFADPGKAKRQQARDLLNDARKARNEAGETAAGAVRAALAHAPQEPKGLDRAKLELLDLSMGASVEMTHFGGGIIKGSAGLINFVRSLNPIDPYNATHPAEYYKGVNMTLAGLVSTVANPDRALKNAWEGFKEDPAEGFGRLIPELLGTKGTGLARGGLRAGLDAKGKPNAKPDGSRTDAQKNPESNAKRCGDNKCDGDPVDMATGRMLLPQVDIVLPASLPLVFQRTFDSSRRSGRWFGPTWSSTVDQRLEIDSEGIVFSCDEGSLLTYPHPAPGVPVVPTHGRQWPLDRVSDGYTISDPDSGRVWHFTDHDEGLALLSQISDRNGRWIAFDYDDSGAPVSIVHHGGYHLRLTTAAGRITELHLAGAAPDDSDQEILRYGYTEGNLTEVTNSSGRPLRFGCDEHGRITSWTDTNGSRYEYVYDEQDRCLYQVGTNGHIESHFAWSDPDPGTGLSSTSITDGLGRTKRFLVNSRSQVVAETDASGAVTRYEFDRLNRLLSRVDPLGHVTSMSYDKHGNLVSTIRPDGREERVEFNTLGRPVRVRGTDGTVTRYTYDERGNRTSVTTATGATTRFTYDGLGHCTSLTDANGHRSTIRCDQRGLPVEATDPLGATTRFERDPFGRLTRLTDPLGMVTRFTWNVEGKLLRRAHCDGSEESWTYDGEGNCLLHTDPMGGTSTFEYTDFDLLVARTGPDSVRYEFEHNTNLQLIRVTNPQGLTWDYSYGLDGRLAAESDFDGRVLTYRYDLAGRLAARTNGCGDTIAYEYNAMGQVLRKNAAGTVTTFEYDVFDQLAVAATSGSVLTRVRDRFGRIRSETVNGRTTSFEHDRLGRRTSRITPSGAFSEWAYDASARPCRLTTSGRTLTFERNAVGKEQTRRIGETITVSKVIDPMGRMLEESITASGLTVQQRGYAYRTDGNLVSVDDQLSGESRRFGLDATGRVKTVHAGDWVESYAYDDAGNQASASWPSSHPGHDATGDRSFTGTRLDAAGGVRYEYDRQGRVVLRRLTRLSRKPETWRYEWDAEDRLTAVVTPDGTAWRYAYDALGRRIEKMRFDHNEQTVRERVLFTWDGATVCEQTTHSETLPNLVTLTWDHDGTRPLAQTERISTADAPQTFFDERFFAIVTDLVGTPTELIDESGRIAWRTRSTLWGIAAWAANSSTYTPLRFPGQYYDPESGLHYNLRRFYDPQTGRYFSPDPLGLSPAPNPFTYVSNPHLRTDPLGLNPCPPVTLAEVKARALREAGVPEGREPFDATDYAMATKPEYQGGGALLGKDGRPIFYREEWYETADGEPILFQDHYFGHREPGEEGYQGPHIHVRPYNDTRNGQIPGCEEHYYYDPALG